MSRLLDMTVVATKFFVTGINPQEQKLGVMISKRRNWGGRYDTTRYIDIEIDIEAIF